MSIENKETIKCPNCGKKNTFIVWKSLNGDIDPYAKQQLLNGTLFTFKCEKCGYTANVDYPILYHDMTNKAMVYYIKEYDRNSSENFFDNVEGKMDFILENYKKRVVSNQNELREKAIIFDNKLDDRIIEIIKLYYFIQVQKDHPEANIAEVYFLISKNNYYLYFLGEKNLTAEISVDTYKKFKNDFMSSVLKLSNNELVIDSTWAQDFIAQLSDD